MKRVKSTILIMAVLLAALVPNHLFADWYENFTDGDISDWIIDNPATPGDSPIILEISNEQCVSPDYSLKISGPTQNNYSGMATGPNPNINPALPYTISFKFRWDSFHFAYFVTFEHVRLIIDYPFLPIKYGSEAGNQFLFGSPNFESYCPANTWTQFRIEVDPTSNAYDIIVDGYLIGTVNYGEYNSGVSGFRVLDTGGGGGNYIQNGYYDDIDISNSPDIIFTSPSQNELNVPVDANIAVTFNTNMDATTINDSTFIVNGSSSGPHQGAISYNSLDCIATFISDNEFSAGELVSVIMTKDIKDDSGAPIINGFSWSFTTKTRGDSTRFINTDTSAYYNFPILGQRVIVFAANLNADELIDFAAASFGDDSINVFFNGGKGHCEFSNQYEVGDDPIAVHVLDLNEDNYMDIITANYNSNDISILFNDGLGSFAPVSSYPVGRTPRALAGADFDNDGDNDLAVATELADSIILFVNNGDGTFSIGSSYYIINGPWSICTADFNNDGFQDLAVTLCWSDEVAILINIGDGSFADALRFETGVQPKSICAGDFDGDGNEDLATANYASANISILINDGLGNFDSPSFYSVGNQPLKICVGDFDGDSDLDLVSGDYGDWRITMLHNNGDASFVVYDSHPTGDFIFSLTTSDLDGCGTLDLVIGTSDYGKIFINTLPGDANHDCILNISDAVYIMAYTFEGGPAPDPNGAGDANGDCAINISDVVWIINYIFAGGPAPRPYCSMLPENLIAEDMPGNAGINSAFRKSAIGKTLTIELISDLKVQAIQMEFKPLGNVKYGKTIGLIDDMQVFSGEVDGLFKVGLLDLKGQTVIPSGSSFIAEISYRGDGELELVDAILVGTDGHEIQTSIKVEKVSAAMPRGFSLFQNYPNPFNPITEISYSLPEACYVKLEIFNIIGQKVGMLVDDWQDAGVHSASWDSGGANGKAVSSGVYFYRLIAGDYVETKKMILMK